MCGLLGRLLKARRALTPRPGWMLQQRATYIHGKPPKDKVSAADTVFVLTVMTVTVLGPSGWILSHLDDYKSRD